MKKYDVCVMHDGKLKCARITKVQILLRKATNEKNPQH